MAELDARTKAALQVLNLRDMAFTRIEQCDILVQILNDFVLKPHYSQGLTGEAVKDEHGEIKYGSFAINQSNGDSYFRPEENTVYISFIHLEIGSGQSLDDPYLQYKAVCKLAQEVGHAVAFQEGYPLAEYKEMADDTLASFSASCDLNEGMGRMMEVYVQAELYPADISYEAYTWDEEMQCFQKKNHYIDTVVRLSDTV